MGTKFHLNISLLKCTVMNWRSTIELIPSLKESLLTATILAQFPLDPITFKSASNRQSTNEPSKKEGYVSEMKNQSQGKDKECVASLIFSYRYFRVNVTCSRISVVVAVECRSGLGLSLFLTRSRLYTLMRSFSVKPTGLRSALF